MALKEFQVICSVINITATGDVIKFRAPFAGTIKEIHIWTDSANTNGDHIFNLNKNGSDLYSGGARPTIAQNQTLGSKTGLSDAVAFGDILLLQLESVATGGVSANLTLQILFDDSIYPLPSGLPYWAVWEVFRESYTNGAQVSSLNDQSGNSRNATQGTSGNQPIFLLNEINGKAAVNYASSKHLGFASLTSLTAMEMWQVTKLNKNVEGVSGTTGIQTIGTAPDTSHYPYTDNAIYDTFGRSTRHSFSKGANDLSNWHCGMWISASGEWTYLFNGIQVYTTTTNTPAFTSNPKLGMSVSTGYEGKIAATYAFSAKLSADERLAMKKYISAVFGLSMV